MSVCLVILGVGAYRFLPVSNLPDVELPYVVIMVAYPGNSPLAMAANVARPIEERVMSIEGLREATSVNRQGTTQIILSFSLKRKIEGIVQDVQSALSQAQGDLPPDLPFPPTFQKVNPAMQPIFWIAVTSDQLSPQDLYNNGGQVVTRRLSGVDGIGQVSVYGPKRAIRIQLNLEILAAKGISLVDVDNALLGNNTRIPVGQLKGPTRTYTIESKGELFNAKEFNEIIVAYRNGAPVRISDLGEAIESLSSTDFRMGFWQNGGKTPRSTIMVAATRQGSANTIGVVEGIKKNLELLKSELPPSIKAEVIYDASEAIVESVDDVRDSLIIAFFLVVAVIFLFLARPMDTLIPTVALPLSFLATFVAMFALNFSLDSLSLMALTLAVGFVVDDAIVVLENTVRRIELGEKPFEAALHSAEEITGTIVSMTLSLVAVFIPLLFMPGLIGRMLHEFSMTVVIAIMASGVISLTVTPLMCARLLKPENHAKRNRLKEGVDKTFNRLLGVYGKGLRWMMKYRWLGPAIWVACIVGMGFLFKIVPKGFLPVGDSGAVMGSLKTDAGLSAERLGKIQDEVIGVMSKNPGMERVLAVSDPANGDTTITTLGILKERKHRAKIEEVVESLNKELYKIPGLRDGVNPLPTISLGGDSPGGAGGTRYTYRLTSRDLDRLYVVSEKLVTKLGGEPSLVNPRVELQQQKPHLSLEILRDEAAALGVTPAALERTLFLAYSGNRISTVNTSTETYDVLIEVREKDRSDPVDLSKIYVPSQTTGKLIPLNAIAHWKLGLEAGMVQHYNLRNMIDVTFGLTPGTDLGAATAAVDKIAKEALEPGIFGAFTGEAQTFAEIVPMMIFLLIVAIFAMYLILGILYENYVDPIVVLTSLPIAGFGGLLTLVIFQVDFSLYAFIGLFMLLGIVKKNGIMLVDFAKMHIEKEGATKEEAIYQASLTRCRPIMMTSLAAIMGAVPVALGFGADGASRQPLGLMVAGGLIFAQFITLYVTPPLYLYAEGFREWFHRKKGTDTPAA